MIGALLSEECANAYHFNCRDEALDVAADEWVQCECGCHAFDRRVA